VRASGAPKERGKNCVPPFVATVARHCGFKLVAGGWQLLGMRVLLVSTPISPIGDGAGGGVETIVRQLAPALRERGHGVTVIAPAGSRLPDDIPLHPVSGSPPYNAATGPRDAGIAVQSDGLLERMWDEARRLAPAHDVIISLTYDWLSFYLTPFLPIPVLHWMTLASSLDVIDTAIREQYSRLPDSFAFCSRTQASTFSFVDGRRARIIPCAVDTNCFPFTAQPEPVLVWAARISPEKGLEDAVRVAQEAGLPLHVCGKIQDQDYWQRIIASVPINTITYHGFLSPDGLSKVLRRAMAMLATPKWVEAFGITVLEALACGTPVIAYAQGGPAEIIEHGKSGILVPPNDVLAMAAAVGRIANLDRADARRRAEEYSIGRMAENIEQWATSVLALVSRPQAIGTAE
jgi:UDP-glucose:tetrahydrobiopterin glucosyltransferase